MAKNQNWANEFQKAFKNIGELYAFLGWEITEELRDVAKTYPLFVPMDLAKQIKLEGPEGILAKEFLPHPSELNSTLNQAGLVDPIGDKNFHVAPQLIHRYNSRALFTPTTICPVHCRYCFRKNELNTSDEIFQHDFVKTLEYLKAHPEITEIIFTGGDPLTLSDQKIEKYLEAFADTGTIRDVRFHTRYPVILPTRIDDDFLELLDRASKKFRTVSIVIHANHAKEFDDKNKKVIAKLAQTRAQVLSQSVLLAGVNDSVSSLLDLFELLIELKVRPYYLHHPDRVKGGMHFYIPLQKGRELYLLLRKNLPGWAIPHYVIDLPGGEGKISAMNPETTSYSGQFLTKNGQVMQLPEADIYTQIH